MQAAVLEFRDRPDKPLFCVERLIEGDYVSVVCGWLVLLLCGVVVGRGEGGQPAVWCLHCAAWCACCLVLWTVLDSACGM